MAQAIPVKQLFFELLSCKDNNRKLEIKKLMHQFLMDRGYKPHKELKYWYHPQDMLLNGLGFDSTASVVVVDTSRFSTRQMEIRNGYTVTREHKKAEQDIIDSLVDPSNGQQSFTENQTP